MNPELWMKVDAALKQNLAAAHASMDAFIKGDEFNKLRSEAEVIKDKAVAFCGDLHEKRDKLPLPVQGSALRHALSFIPGGGLACAAADAVLMVGSMGQSGVDSADEIADQTPDSESVQEQLIELRRRISELEKESEVLKNQLKLVISMLSIKCPNS